MGYLFALAFGYLSWWFHKKWDLKNKYEFDNRSDGGVVQFSSYELGKRHAREKNLYNGFRKLFLLLAIFSLFLAILPPKVFGY
jgi:hypothetical protein